MDLDDVLDSQVTVAAAATAAVVVPPIRKVLRRGAVYGVTGILVLGDALSAFASGVGRGLRRIAPPHEGEAKPGEEIQATAVEVEEG